MAIGFSNRFDFSRIIGWELYQVTIDKYHVMFWFENELALLNVADRFAFASSDGTVRFEYQIYGDQKTLNLDRILRLKVTNVTIVSSDRLDLRFENGDILSVFDNPDMRSWWFLGGRSYEPAVPTIRWAFEIDDWEPEDLTDAERAERLR